PPGSKTSYTEREHEIAVEKDLPRLLFFAGDDLPMSPNLREGDALWKRQQKFRKRVLNERIGDFFKAPDPLATQVVKALGNLRGKPRVSKPVRTKVPADLTQATATYLKFLVERYRYLDFKGLGVSDRVPLRLPLLEMYVPLKARV